MGSVNPYSTNKFAEKKSPEVMARFLEVLAQGWSVSKSAIEAGVSPVIVYKWRKEDEEFAKAWAEAVEVGTDTLEDAVLRRARDGVEKPVFYQGEQCGSVQEYSDTLAAFMLKARRPEKYKERTATELTGANGAPLPLVYLPSNGRDEGLEPPLVIDETGAPVDEGSS